MIRPVDALLEFLVAEQARGVTHVHLDEAARIALREVHALTKSGGIRPGEASASTSMQSSTAATAADLAALSTATDAAPAISPSRPVPVSPPSTADLSTPPATSARADFGISLDEAKPVPVTTTLNIPGSTPAEQLDSLRRQAENWGPAKSLGTLRETMVFSTGNPEARVMLVGEAPGFQEEKEREPFVGPAGQKLNDILKAMGISREEVYISNIVKFRPATARQTTNNRKPTVEEMAACMPFVLAEIGIVKPECIIALGGTAAEGLLAMEGSTVTSMRGKWHEIKGIPLRVTYHPSYLLQSGGGTNTKRQVWEDMLAVMEKISLPISEKQRGYFLPKP